MAEESYQIEKHIELTRSNLGGNLRELEQIVKHSTDWRTHFERNPAMVLGVALGGGALLGMITGGKGHRRALTYGSDSRHSPSGGNENTLLADTWGNVKGALVGLTVEKLRNAVNQALPGFGEHYDRLDPKRSSSSRTW